MCPMKWVNIKDGWYYPRAPITILGRGAGRGKPARYSTSQSGRPIVSA